MPTIRPGPHLPFNRRQVIRIVVACGAVAFTAGYLISDLVDGQEVLTWLARAGASVASVTLFVLIMEIRLARQLARSDTDRAQQLLAIQRRLDCRLHDAEFAEGYVKGLRRRPPNGDDDGPHLHAV